MASSTWKCLPLTACLGRHVAPSQAEEEVRSLQKKIQQIENELDQVQEQLSQANSKLEEKDKALQAVSIY